MNTLDKAKELLHKGKYTCVLIKDNIEYTSTDRGVKPLLDLMKSGIDFKECSAADKVVGKAAAYLYVLLGVKEIYAAIISEPAYEVLKMYGIDIYYESVVPAIRNRDNTGYCPMETSVLDIDNPDDAYEMIIYTRDRLAKNAGI